MSLRKLSIVCLVLVLLGVISPLHAGPVGSFQSAMDDKDRQEIVSLAARIMKVVMSGDNFLMSDKRNGGTIDSLYNLPHLLSVGKRR